MNLTIPPEILEKIFSYLDGRTLILVSRVNKTWNEESKRLAKKLDTWCSCIEEIPKTHLVELTTNLDLHLPLAHTDNLPEACLLKNWRSVYVNWWLWTQLSKWTTTDINFKVPEEVICAKLSGDCIITGHTSGEIRVWNAKGRLVAISRTHRCSVRDLLLVSLGSDYTFENAEWCKTYPRTNLGLAHHCVITSSEDEQLAITYFTGTYGASTILKLHQPDYFIESDVVAARAIPTTACILVVLHNSGTFTGRIYKGQRGPDSKLVLNSETSFRFPGFVFIKSISCYPEKTVTALVTLNRRQSFYRINLDKEFDKSSFTLLCQANNFMQNAKIFRNNICLWIGNSATTGLHIHANNIPSMRNTYEVRPTLPAVPVCFHLHGSVLFMGTSMGSVIAFDARELPTLDLGKPLWTKHLDCGPIRVIHTLDCHSELRLIAVSRQRVFYFEFKTSHCKPFL